METTERVTLEGDYIRHTLPADFNVEILRADKKLLLKYGTLLRDQGKDVLLLADASSVPKLVSTETRKQALDNIDSLDPKRSAVFGASRYIGYMANWMIKAMGWGNRIRLLATEQEALDWLLEKRSGKGEDRERKAE